MAAGNLLLGPACRPQLSLGLHANSRSILYPSGKCKYFFAKNQTFFERFLCSCGHLVPIYTICRKPPSAPPLRFSFSGAFFSSARREKGAKKRAAALFRLLIPYSMTLDTTPEATVRPPSRMANRRPSSMAMGVISLIVIVTWSPGMTISTPSGSWMEPVTSVVRK